MKILIGTVLALSVLAAQPAAAAPRYGFGGGRMDVQMQQRPGGYQRQAPPQRQFQRPPQRDFQRPEQGRDFQRSEPPDRRRDGRLTDEERRDLHRDLDRASREIYKGRR